MPKKQNILPSDHLDNMMQATEEYGGAMVGVSEELTKAQGIDLDPVTLREYAACLITVARDINQTAVLLLSHARRVEVSRQLAAIQGGKKD